MSKGLEDLKVGDKVFLNGGSWQRIVEIRTVSKVGKLHIQLEGLSAKFRVVGGGQVNGDRWSSAWISRYDESKWKQYQEEKRDKKIRKALSAFEWHKCSKELAVAVFSLIEADAHVGRAPQQTLPEEGNA
jgi:hypothetical protein